jgi:hypothetical protein
MPLVEITRVLDHYVIIASQGDAVVLGLACTTLVTLVMWLANRPQPTPAWVGT